MQAEILVVKCDACNFKWRGQKHMYMERERRQGKSLTIVECSWAISITFCIFESFYNKMLGKNSFLESHS
jgi:hypothetical protein